MEAVRSSFGPCTNAHGPRERTARSVVCVSPLLSLCVFCCCVCFHVRVGKGATKAEREKGMSHGQDYLKKTNKPDWTKLTRLPGGGESPAFKSYFVQFDKVRWDKRGERIHSAQGTSPLACEL